MRVWIFSDLHITDSDSPLYQSFLRVLSDIVEDSDPGDDHVVFAGDIFDLMVGKSRFFGRKYSQFFEVVGKLSRKKVHLYYIEGNHDFHIRNLFTDSVIRFPEESVVIPIRDPSGKGPIRKRLFIAHGDLVDREDTEYLRLRKFFRSSFIRSLLESVPGQWIQSIGGMFSRPLRQKESDLPQNWTSSRREKLRSVFRAYAEHQHRQGFDYVVLGHCHDLDAVEPFYFNMGYPPVHRQYLVYDSGNDLLKRVNFAGI